MSMNKHLFLLHSVHWSHDLSSSFSIYHSFNYSCLPFNSVTKKTFIHSFPLVNWTVPLAFSITLTFIPRPLSAAPPQQDVSGPPRNRPLFPSLGPWTWDPDLPPTSSPCSLPLPFPHLSFLDPHLVQLPSLSPPSPSLVQLPSLSRLAQTHTWPTPFHVPLLM